MTKRTDPVLTPEQRKLLDTISPDAKVVRNMAADFDHFIVIGDSMGWSLGTGLSVDAAIADAVKREAK